MGKYQGYEKYKDSSVEWLGKIPEHWDSISISRLTSKITNGYVGPTRDILVESGIRYIQSLHIKNGKVLFERGHYFVKKEWSDKHQKSKLKVGDILIVQTGDIGQTALVRKEYENCNCHALIIMTPIKEKIDGSFLELFLRSQIGQYFLKCYQTGALHPHLNGTQIKDIKITLPPLDEQKAIARFIDHKTKQIDDLIAKKETLIEKLDEKRTALISHAVTKGIDPSVPMKDSGIEWLGKIPEHWKVIRIKRAFILQRGVDIRQEDQTEGVVPVVSSGGIASYHNVAYAKSPGVLVGRKGTVGNVHYVEVDYWPHDTTLWITEFYNNNPRFIYYKLLSMNLEDWDTGSANPTLNRNLIHPLKTPWTSREEQENITEYLDQKTIQIEQQKAKIKEAIERLKEYRTSLITNAVIGKIDVRQVPIP